MSHEKINHQHSKNWWSKHVELTKAPAVPGPATVGILQRQKHMGLAACRHPIFGQHMICSIGWFFIFNHCRIGWRMQYSTLAGNPSLSQMTSSPSHLPSRFPPKIQIHQGWVKHAQRPIAWKPVFPSVFSLTSHTKHDFPRHQRSWIHMEWSKEADPQCS